MSYPCYDQINYNCYNHSNLTGVGEVVNPQTFFAGIKSSQRSESINAFFDGFVHSNTPLSEFIDQYDNVIAGRRNKELDEDFVCMVTKSDLTKVTPLESHASQVYTRNVFVKFKEEFDCVFHCHRKKLKKNEDKSTYEVTYSCDDKPASHIVNVGPDYNFECSCAKFENAGNLWKKIDVIEAKQSSKSSVQVTPTPEASQPRITNRDPRKCKTKG
ncbi:hypothetical protein POM88_050920 [Heracleum sosnowskyi]|uniref:Protein FAR1-RELATED SEQUENCE n=1 Tax=Heracleum sosnowskyi TaxID=360622 RepID=A0AAD8M2X5_9APIA|nr:hypothetical protein POM88_050920 [Heracleum sosnowskyi]